MDHLVHEEPRPTLEVACDVSHRLLEQLHDGLYDVVLAMSAEDPIRESFRTWHEPLTWVGASERADAPAFGPPVRIVCYPRGCVYRQRMLEALQHAGLDFEVVYASPNFSGIEAAVASGFGLTALARRIVPPTLESLPSGPGLPALGDARVSLYLGDQSGGQELASLAARFADLFAGVEPAPPRETHG
jgi:DNA-binding transcriptional LysR family regulator